MIDKKLILIVMILGVFLFGCAKPQIRVQNDYEGDLTPAWLLSLTPPCSDLTVTINEVTIDLKGLNSGQKTDYSDINPADSINVYETFIQTNRINNKGGISPQPNSKLEYGKKYTFHFISGTTFITPDVTGFNNNKNSITEDTLLLEP